MRKEVVELVEVIAAATARRKGSPPDMESRPGAAVPSGMVSPAQAVRRLAGLIDHTLLRPEATRAQVEQLCGEARRFGCATACVSPSWVSFTGERLRGSPVKVATVVGFPFGATLTVAKRAEAEVAILAGAQEIDMVMNIGAMKSGDLDRVESDIRGVVEVCHQAGVLLKVILENAYLSDEEKVAACRIAQRAGADYVKTSTGLAPAGATEGDVRLMRQTVGPAMGVKAAGGIRTLADALRFLEAGADRLGTSAAKVILEEAARL